MDVDADDQNLSLVPYQARIAIYDSSTSNYYDYVRIDLRGNTSARFTKKGHGLRFAKVSSSAIPFSSCPQSLPASGSFPMSQLFT